MRSHPDDEALLDQLTFTQDHPCAIDRGQHPHAPTARHGDDWICRTDLTWRLHFERCQTADNHPRTPTPAPTP